MLDWCQNRPNNQSFSEILIPQIPNSLPSLSQPPKFTNRNQKQIRKIKPTPRTVQILTMQPKTVTQEVQTVPELAFKPLLVDSYTQTSKLQMQTSLSCNGHTQTTLRLPTPFNHLDNSYYLKIDSLKHDQFESSIRSRKQSGDYKWENNVRTKATYCLADTKDRGEFCERGRQGVIGVQSYHIPSSSNMQQSSPKKQKNVWFKQSIIHGSPSLIFSPNGERCNLNYTGVNREISSNLKNQFKRSQQKSLNHSKYTPERLDKRLLYERDTIMSKFTQSHARQSSRQIKIQQSVIVERQVSSLFTPMTEISNQDYFAIYLAREDQIGFAVSIKEFEISQMNHISEQLLIYKELQAKGNFFTGILSLYQTQIDRSSYMFIKQPYTKTVKDYLKTKPDLNQIILQVHDILQQMTQYGFLLRKTLKIQDLVEVYQQIKIQNAGIFTLDNSQEFISVDDALLTLRSELLWWCE